MKIVSGAVLLVLLCYPAVSIENRPSWIHQGFEDFSQGTFDDGGSNLYVNADGVMELIRRWDVNNDGYVDLVLANNHDIQERGPTVVFRVERGSERGWKSRTLPNDSGHMSSITDLDQDGVADLIVVNAYDGISSRQFSYVYWGGSGGPTDKRADLFTVGAHDVAAFDIDRDGLPDLVFPSAWEDPHNLAKPRPCTVYLQRPGRKFLDATGKYKLLGVGAQGVAAGDLNRDGFADLIVGNSRIDHNPKTDSFIYWGTAAGFNPQPQKLPTQAAGQVKIADMNRDGFDDVLISCGEEIWVYWSKNGSIEASAPTVVPGGRFAIADIDGDQVSDLISAQANAVSVRSGTQLHKVAAILPIRNASWITAADLNKDGRPDLVVSRNLSEGSLETESAVFWNGPDGFSLSVDPNTRGGVSPPVCAWLPTRGAMGNAAGDLDGDGRMEVVINSTGGGHLQSEVPSYVYLGGKDGYGVKNRLELPTAGASVGEIADFDRDGYNDMVFKTMSIYNGGGFLASMRVFWGSREGLRPDRYLDLETPTSTGFGCRVADFNKDGYLDIFAQGAPLQPLEEQIAVASTIFWGSKTGFSSSNHQRVSNYGYHSGVADVNRDGWLDLIFDDRRDFILIHFGGPEGYSDARSVKLPCNYLGEGGVPNFADINKDGWLDLVMGMNSSRVQQPDTVHIYFGGPDGYRAERKQSLIGGYSSGYTGIADFDRDGNLDLMVSAYQSPTSRVLPAQLFRGNGREIDFTRPQNLFSEGSTALVQIDLNKDGWVDAFVVCHRDNTGHQVNSRIYWNGPQGFTEQNVTLLPGLGPHGATAADFGHAYHRKPWEEYVSPIHDMGGAKPANISWLAEVPQDASLQFQVRSGPTRDAVERAAWTGPTGPGSFYERSGEAIGGVPAGTKFIQYKARFTYRYGCLSPKLRRVRIDFD